MQEIGGHLSPWHASAWRPEAEAWIGAELDRFDIRITGSIEPRVRPWSIVLRVPSSSGDIYFKATAEAMANDARITAALARWAPRDVLHPLATDEDRGWMLLPDGGQRLRDVISANPDIGHWERILPRYAELQIAAAEHAAELASIGALDRRPASMPDLYEELLADEEALCMGAATGLSDGELDRLHMLEPQLQASCTALAEGGIPLSLQHDDLHDGNVLVDGGEYRLFDWGDTGIAHPFGTLLVTLRSIADRFGLAETGPELDRLRAAYLEPWAQWGSAESLRQQARAAEWVAMAGRALAWRAALSTATLPEQMEHAFAVPEWLRDFAAAA